METNVENIIKTVSELYQKYGIRSVTMDDVARKLGISKKTLYQIVPDKSNLVKKVMLSHLEKMQQQVKDIEQKKLNAIEHSLEVNKLINKIITHHNPAMEYDLKKYYPSILNTLVEKRRETMYESIVKNMKKGIKEGLFRKDLKVEIITKLQILRSDANIDCEFYDLSKNYKAHEIFNEIYIYHLRGICNKKGLDFLEKKLEELKLKNNNQ
jgi:TetR/AcrR family transcriptional regulator, cholesterol catabolism regulator